jgi:sugar lactone lactonase YvrE
MKTNLPLSPRSLKNRTGKTLSLLSAVAALIVLAIFAESCKKKDDPTPVVELSILSISPNTGSDGTAVTIVGTGFSTTAAENEVTLNGKTCPVTSAAATQLHITIPVAAGTGVITVKVGSKTATSSTFTYLVPLAIASIAPTSGPKGTSVVITGTGFSATAASNIVTIHGVAAEVTTASETALTIVIPAGAATGPISVKVGTNTVQSQEFTYVITLSVHTLAGAGSGFNDGTGIAALFSGPYNVATDASGNVYVSDASNHRIRKITPEGVTTTLAGSGVGGDVLGTGAAAQLNYPYGVAVDATGNVIIADTFNHKIKKISPAGEVTLIAGSTGGYMDAVGAAAQFNYPTSVTLDANGTIYVADKDNHKIRKIATDGTVSTLAGSTSGYANGTGTAAQFSQPYDLAVDASGNVYVIDTGNHRVRKITPAGEVTSIAGNGVNGDADGTGDAAQFYYPYGIAIDSHGDLFVADTFNQKVKKVTQAGVTTTYAGSTGGTADGDPATAQFNYLTGIDVSSQGIIYIADKDNNRIRYITAD